MDMPLVDPATVFQPVEMPLDSRFTTNTGGDGSNMVSRQKYELIEAINERDPILTLEIYTKFNANVPDQRELHGNLILEAELYNDEYVEMGFMFSPDPLSANFDGMLVTSNTYKTLNWSGPVFSAQDLWLTERPWTDGQVDMEELTKDSANDWNITADKSKLVCPNSGRCTIHAHWNRKFSTDDSLDFQFEHGKFLGYEVIGFYNIQKTGNTDSNAVRSDLSIENYILMGAVSGLSQAAVGSALAALYVAFTF